jgi:ribbon-helix-helix CopG family protein
MTSALTSRTCQIGVRVPENVRKRLDAVCKRDSISMSEALNRALEAWLTLMGG